MTTLNTEPKILILRLISGEEIVGKVKKTETNFIVEKPYQLIVNRQQSAEHVGLAVVPYCKFNINATIELQNNHVIFSHNAPEQIEKAYSEQTSGLVLPNNPTGKQLIKG